MPASQIFALDAGVALEESRPQGGIALGVSAVRREETVSDHELLAAVQSGSEEAFEEIVTRYRNPITNYIYRMLEDYELAVDLAQETFLRIFQAADRYQANYAFSTYIYRIATNLAISELRKRKRRKLVSLNFFFASGDESEERNTEWQPPDEKPLPPAELETRQRDAAVMRAIGSLPEKYRAPVVLRDIEGKSYEEIACILDANEGTIKSRISRGRSMLRTKLSQYF